MYFTKEQVSALLATLVNTFEKGYLAAEFMHPKMTNTKRHDTVKIQKEVFGRGVENGHELEQLQPQMKLKKETSLNEIMKRYTLRGRLFCIVCKNLNNRAALYKW